MTSPSVYDDGAFSIDVTPSTQFYQSYDRNGHALIYSATEWECVYWTRKYLKAKQEGWDTEATVTDAQFVGGKL